MLRDQYEFEYQLDHHFSLLHWILSSFCWAWHAFSLGLLSHFLGLTHPFTLLSLAWCFGICSLIMIIFYTTHLSWSHHSLFDLWFNFQLEAHIFTFTLFFFKRFILITLSFLFMELILKVESRICGYRWSIDLVIVCFSHFFFLSWIIDTNSLVIFVAIS